MTDKRPEQLTAAQAEIQRQFDEETTIRTRRCAESTRPLFIPDGDTIEHIGSCVLFQIGAHFFITSASHVFDHVKDAGFFIGGPAGVIEAGGEIYRSFAEGRSIEEHDIAFMELPPDTVDRLHGCRFLEVAEVVPEHSSQQESFYMAAGYPIRKTRIDRERSTYSTPIASFVMRESPQAYGRLGLNGNTHVVLHFDRKQIMRGRVLQMPPKPNGLSGGGAWILERLVGDLRMHFVGILTQYHEGSTKAMIATRISVLFEAIRVAFPGLDSDLPRASTIRPNVTLE